jgi:GntR family transcriptional regulator
MAKDLTYSSETPDERRLSELGLKIDKRSNLPIFVQLLNSVKFLIASGQLTAGDRLPSVRKLARELEINPNTVDKAYINLESEGFIVIEKGRGTFVRRTTPFEVSNDERIRQLDTLTREYLNSVFRLGFSREEILKEIQSKANLKND